MREIPVEGLRALLAEDNELNMEITKFMLEDYRIHVECAADGEEAVQKVQKSELGYYDVIFMDIMMPKLNGWDDPQDPVHETVGCRKCPHHCHERQCLCGNIINSRWMKRSCWNQ